MSNHERIDVVATRTRESFGDVRIWAPALLFIVFLPLSVLTFTDLMWNYDDTVDSFMLVFGIILLATSVTSLVWLVRSFREIRQNNKCRNPTIGVTESGVFVLFHANGSREFLTDKVVQAAARRHQEHSQRQSGNYVITTTKIFSHGWVKFMLEKPTGEVYYKKVKHVTDCIEAAEHIERIISYRQKPNVTGYEQKLMFCQYCGAKNGPADKFCAKCGGKVG